MEGWRFEVGRRLGLRHETTYSGCRLNEIRAPSGLGLSFLGSQLALVTALGSKVVSGKRESLRWTALYMKGACMRLMTAHALQCAALLCDRKIDDSMS